MLHSNYPYQPSHRMRCKSGPPPMSAVHNKRIVAHHKWWLLLCLLLLSITMRGQDFSVRTYTNELYTRGCVDIELTTYQNASTNKFLTNGASILVGDDHNFFSYNTRIIDLFSHNYNKRGNGRYPLRVTYFDDPHTRSMVSDAYIRSAYSNEWLKLERGTSITPDFQSNNHLQRVVVRLYLKSDAIGKYFGVWGRLGTWNDANWKILNTKAPIPRPEGIDRVEWTQWTDTEHTRFHLYRINSGIVNRIYPKAVKSTVQFYVYDSEKGESFATPLSPTKASATQSREAVLNYHIPVKSVAQGVKMRLKVEYPNHIEVYTPWIYDNSVPAISFPFAYKARRMDDGSIEHTWKVDPIQRRKDPFPAEVTGDTIRIIKSDTPDFKRFTDITNEGILWNTGGLSGYRFIEPKGKNETADNSKPAYYMVIRAEEAKRWPNVWRYGTGNYVFTFNSPVKKHIAVDSAWVSIEKGEARVSWINNRGNTWSPGSAYYITVTNTANGLQREVLVDSAKIKHSTDNLQRTVYTYSIKITQTCVRYEYTVYVNPGGDSFKSTIHKVDATNEKPIVLTELGNIVEGKITASKGYYSDKIQLEWQTDGLPVDIFSVRSRIKGSDDSWKQIGQVEGNDATNTYQYEDRQAQAGLMYEYQVVPMASCAGITVKQDTVPTVVGFRTPTGNIYGRVAFESGQGVPQVEVRAEATDGSGIVGRSLEFFESSTAQIPNTLLKNNTNSFTVSAWVKYARIPNDDKNIYTAIYGNGTVLKKDGLFRLGIQDSKPIFELGSDVLVSDSILTKYFASNGEEGLLPAQYVNLAATATPNEINLYVNGKKVATMPRTTEAVESNNPIFLGGDGFVGNIDEVRLWNVALSADTIMRDYNRRLVGNENGLAAYYNFDYAVDGEFFDISYEGTRYHSNHGTYTDVYISQDVPTDEQLGYKAITNVDGSYTINALPYAGNGTTYMIVPRFGIHQFASAKELRLVSQNSQSHTVNFTDKSSFPVSGKVVYKGGTIPVEGVSFKVDGITVVDGKGVVVTTNPAGEFLLHVPVGRHEVKAVKTNHVFVGEGKITNIDGTDVNYQDMRTGIVLEDSTTVRYIGRIAGGAIQEAYPVGFSLSKNNLGDNIKLTLQYQNDAYKLSSSRAVKEVAHNTDKETDSKEKTRAVYDGNTVTITPSIKTGEFFVDLIPEKYLITVSAPGHDRQKLPGDGEMLDLSNSLREDTDTLQANKDVVRFGKKQQFIKRYTPTVDVAELDENFEVKDHFGVDSIEVTTLAKKWNFKVYDKTNASPYLVGCPVYRMYDPVSFKANVYEVYPYYNSRGDSINVDKVPVPEAVVSFGSSELLRDASAAVDTTNADGFTTISSYVGIPELTSGKRSLSALVTLPNSNTTISWKGFSALVKGDVKKGADFYTQGPDEVLFVLRDPPGSNSYAYLEEGTVIEHSVTYNGSVRNEGTEDFNNEIGAKFITWTGAGPAGVVNETEIKNEFGVALVHKETVGRADNWTHRWETVTRYQTSDDPLYVGSNADLYVGVSTNIGIAATEFVSIVPKSLYELKPDNFEIIPGFETTDTLYVVKTVGAGFSKSYGTSFAYTQVHIEQVLIPKLEELRNNLILLPQQSSDKYQAMADAEKRNIYVSKISDRSSKDFGRKGQYDVYRPQGGSDADTIAVFNTSIDNWIARIKENEEEKAKAESQYKKIDNYSFQAGATFELSNTYHYSNSRDKYVEVEFGSKVHKKTGFGFNDTGIIFVLDEQVTTAHAVNVVDTDEKHKTIGFVLADNGDDDYISVDVYRKTNDEGDTELDTYIFRTRGGATSCPHEPEEYSKYYEENGEKVLLNAGTVKLEVPEIAVEKAFIENVPSGKSAFVTLYLRNNSEAKEDAWYNLRLVDGSNPDGAQLVMDGAPVGNGRSILVPAGETLVKTLEVRKGKVMNYDNLQLALTSQCQFDPTDFLEDIADTVSFTVHFTPSATPVRIRKPNNNWTYNTKLSVDMINGLPKHHMTVVLDEFDVNYDNFDRIMLQYKSKSGGESDWVTLMNFYNDAELLKKAKENGLNATEINAKDAGTITYEWFLDDMPDQLYDLRAVGVSKINNQDVYNYSEVYSGIKDMYNPRLFGVVEPADGVLDVEDNIKLTFNEKIAEGLLNDNNFQVIGTRNGIQNDHSVSLELDGNDVLTSEVNRNWTDKDITVEMWIMPEELQDAVLFSHGRSENALELGITADKKLKVKVGDNEITSIEPIAYEKDNWAHVAMTLSRDGSINAYYNFINLINNVQTKAYTGEGTYAFGADVNKEHNFRGKMHGARIWDRVRTSGQIQTESLIQLSGAEANLLAAYPMNEGKGDVVIDAARGANLNANGTKWALPEGRAAVLNGANQYVRVNTSSTAVIDNSMDYTVEFWFKADTNQPYSHATMLANGKGDGTDVGGSQRLMSIGFEDGMLVYHHNGNRFEVPGKWMDNNWHHFALAVNRTAQRGQIYMDGKLNSFFDSDKVGGLAARYMYIGARGYTDETNLGKDKADNFFKGTIDEVRVWKLYKSEQLVEQNNHTQLDGTEKGLLAYYPFQTFEEHQGVKEMVFSLNDMKQPEQGVKAEVGEQFGVGSIETKIASPVKNKGAIAKLRYDYVVNNDALIINLLEPIDRIENTIVTFTVDGVSDMNGNEMLSPVTWSAYINRNQLRWSESEIKVEKKYRDEASFTVKATNKGGALLRYTIENMPAWLSVSPIDGVLDPLQSKEIKFVVNEGLNIGTYDEVIYLRGENGVAEALSVNVRVLGEKPNWNVNPGDFKYSMNITGKLRFNGVYSNDKEDILAAFENGKCIGVATGTYNKIHDMYYTFLTVYNNALKAKNIEFRMWDASTGKVYSATPSQTIEFANGANYGTAADPVIFEGKEMFISNIALNKGWNWISFNLASDQLKNVNSALADGTWRNGDVVKNNDSNSDFATYSAKQKKWTGPIEGKDAFDNVSMYMLRSTYDQVFSVTGMAIDAKTMPITINGGKWNYISYLPNVAYTVTEALAGYDAKKGDIIKSQSQFATYSGKDWVGSLTYMEPNKGYMLKRIATDNATFTYPTTKGTLNLAPAAIANANNSYANTEYADNMTIVAKALNAQPGDQIAAYVGEELRGLASIVNYENNELQYINVAGVNDGEPINFKLLREGEIVAMASTRAAYQTNATNGTLDAPMVIDFGPMVSQAEVYPSPFTTVLNIDVNVVEPSDVTVEIFDISGTKVWSKVTAAQMGWNHIVWNATLANGNAPADGVYVVNIIANGEKFVKKVIKK